MYYFYDYFLSISPNYSSKFQRLLLNNKTFYISQGRFTSYNHDVYTEEANNIALSNNDDKRIQTFAEIETYPYGTNAFKICECEMLIIKDLFFEMLLKQQ